MKKKQLFYEILCLSTHFRFHILSHPFQRYKFTRTTIQTLVNNKILTEHQKILKMDEITQYMAIFCMCCLIILLIMDILCQIQRWKGGGKPNNMEKLKLVKPERKWAQADLQKIYEMEIIPGDGVTPMRLVIHNLLDKKDNESANDNDTNNVKDPTEARLALKRRRGNRKYHCESINEEIGQVENDEDPTEATKSLNKDNDTKIEDLTEAGEITKNYYQNKSKTYYEHLMKYLNNEIEDLTEANYPYCESNEEIRQAEEIKQTFYAYLKTLNNDTNEDPTEARESTCEQCNLPLYQRKCSI